MFFYCRLPDHGPMVPQLMGADQRPNLHIITAFGMDPISAQHPGSVSMVLNATDHCLVELLCIIILSFNDLGSLTLRGLCVVP